MVHLGHGVASGQSLGTLDLANADATFMGLWGDDSHIQSVFRAATTAGDFNGDGFDNIILGDRNGDRDGLTNRGEAWIFDGSGSGVIPSPAAGCAGALLWVVLGARRRRRIG